MKLHHIAYWTHDIQRLSDFYQQHFQAEVCFDHSDGDFSCRFISLFGGVHLELMTKPALASGDLADKIGHSHISVEVESKAEVIRLSEYFIAQGVPLEKNQIQYEDGFFESSVYDPDGNIIEIATVDRAVKSW